ncbi:MAG TPA: hypothetical protein VGM30_24785 [Puia sp.]|jgi:hypothetical protein
MTKVYLAKSNRADPDEVAKVRKYLQTLDCEVKEFQGGKYTNNDLLTSDILLMVGEEVPELDELLVGKGLYTQLTDFAQKNWDFNEYEWRNSAKLALVVSQVGDNIYVDEVNDWDENNTDDWSTEYGRISTNGMKMNIGNYISPKYNRRISVMKDPGSSKIKPMLFSAVALGVI